MARIIGFLLGELRGALGGTVFARNKAGAYVRQRVTPVNPQTVRQQTARYRFGNMSILFQSLSTAQKSCWEVFAGTHFNPLKGSNTGIYSGGNAFVALRQSVGQGNQYNPINIGSQDSISYDIESTPYLESLEPPTAPTSATIQCSDSTSKEFQITSILMDSNGKINFNLEFPTGIISPTVTFDSFMNAESQRFGIGFYISNNLKFKGSKPNTALKLNVADTQIVTNIDKTTGSGAPVVGLPFEMIANNSIIKADIRDFPCEGDEVLITPFIRSENGAIKKMTPQYVTVSAV